MNGPARQFPFLTQSLQLGQASLAPMMPIQLRSDNDIATTGLVDSGAAINVLPYSLGGQLGFDWVLQTRKVALTGNLASIDARVVVVSAVVADFAPVRMAFAWAKSDSIPLILGQVNFFLEFDVCFFRSRGQFEVRPRP